MKKTTRFFEYATQPREGACSRAPRRPWTAARPAALPAALLTSYFFLLTCCGLPAASAADLALDGRWLDAASNAVANANVPATMKVYTNDAADAAAIASAPVTLATDSEGFFRTAATNLSLPSGCQTYWLGVTPQDGDEIAPRMKVSPAPFALRAAEARTVEAETLKVEGTVTIGRLTNSTATAGTVAVTDNLSIRGIGGFDQLYLDGIDLGGGGRLALFRKVPDQSGSFTVHVGLSQRTDREVANPVPPDDGILCVRLTISGRDIESCSPDLIIGQWNKYREFLRVLIPISKLHFPTSDRSYHLILPVRGGEACTINAGMSIGVSALFSADMTVDYTFYAAGIE